MPTEQPPDTVARLLAEAKSLNIEREDIKDRMDRNRKALRALADADELNESQKGILEGYYPMRKRKGKTAEQENK